MEKFFNLMYDFFAFAFPGVAMIGSLLFLNVNDSFLYCKLLGPFNSNPGHLLLIMIFAGYIVGYIVRPIAKYLLLRKLSVFIYLYLFLWFKQFIIKAFSKDRFNETWKNFLSISSESKKRYVKKQFKFYFEHCGHSKMFVRIREHAPNAAQYIEFWDMHITMAYNFAFACILFLLVYFINWNIRELMIPWFSPITLLVIICVSFFVLLRISFNYVAWWCEDVKAANDYAEEILSKLKQN